jgi:hypothetical protein
MLKALRILAGSLLAALLLHAADLAVRDCTAGVLTLDNCLWLWLREKLGLRQSKLGRIVLLELVGLALLAGLYLTFRYVFPFSGGKPIARPEPGESSAADSPPTPNP